MIELRQRWPLLILCGYGLLCAAIALHLYNYPTQIERADAWGYINHAFELRADGLLGKLSSWRTYGYIWFLYFCSLVFGTGREALVWGAVCVQAALYLTAVAALAATIMPRSRHLACAVGIGLLSNPILVAIVMDTLTESLTLIAAVFLLTILLQAARAPTFAAKLPWLIGGAALASFSIMIRPANLPLLLAWNVAVSPVLFGPSLRSTAKALLVYALIVVTVSLLVWTPQLIITARHFGQASIFPVALGDFQATMGIKLLKYATRVKADHIAAGMFYPNPWLTSLPDTQPWHWYLSNPGAGVLTAASHVFNALNYDHPFVYVYDISLPYSVPLAFMVWLIYSLAVIDIAICLRDRRDFLSRIPEFGPGLLFVATMTAASLATIAISAVESRFSTLILAVAGVFASHCLLRLRHFPAPQRSQIVAAAIVIGVCGTLVSEWMKSLISLIPIV
jgi:hypothetical protein